MRFGFLWMLFFALIGVACSHQNSSVSTAEATAGTAEWNQLLDPKLSRWDNYLSYQFKPGYSGEKPDGEPVGLNQPEGQRVFTTQLENGETVLRISGEIYGALISKSDYRNYHLKLKVRWGEDKLDPRKTLLRDTGIIYHSIGSYGAEYWRSWMLGQELQIMEGHIGDFWSQATSAIDIRVMPPEYIMNPIASLTRPFMSFGYEQEAKQFVLRRKNMEKPHGEWNIVELICFEGRSLHIVNGEIVMVLKNSRYNKGYQFIPLLEGKIQLQSEAAEVFYKNIEVKELDAMPAEYAALF